MKIAQVHQDKISMNISNQKDIQMNMEMKNLFFHFPILIDIITF